MTEIPNITTERQSQLLSELEVLAAERGEVERNLASNRVARQNAANESFQTLREAEVRRNGELLDRIEKERNRALSEAKRTGGNALRALEEEETRFERTGPKEHQERLDTLKRKAAGAKIRSEEEYENATRTLKQQWVAFENGWRSVEAQHQQLLGEIQTEASRRNVTLPDGHPDELTAPLEGESPLEKTLFAMRSSQEHLEELRSHFSAKFFDEGWTVLLIIFTGLAAIYPAGRWLGWTNYLWGVVAIGSALAVALLARLIAGWRVRSHAQAGFPEIANLADAATHQLNQAWGGATSEAESKRQNLKQQLHDQVQQLGIKLRDQCKMQQTTFDAVAQEAREGFQSRRNSIDEKLQAQVQSIEDKHQPQLQREKQRHEETIKKLVTENQEALARSQKAYDDGMEQLVQRWTDGLARFIHEVSEMNEYCREKFPSWDIDWSQWKPATSAAVAFPYGKYVVDVDQYGEPPEDARLSVEDSRIELPAALAFPDRPSLLLEASDEGKQQAVAVMQTLMLRLLMAVPPGKIRFTIIDPEALGQNFSAFMHLSDFDEQTVGPRIWTEQQQIQQQLVDLTEHTENVIQKYLRNEFASIQQYNDHAGEVAEPYRVLVVANFPEGFTDESTRRLVSIAATGAKCGVFTLISIDTRKKLPRDFYVDELESHATSLQWTHHGFRPKDARLRTLPFQIDAPPDEETFTRAIRTIGQHAQDADKVEVPFELVAPSPENVWESDCRAELEVALGRAGATKLQHLRLGRGVSQHVLISGKTGSGKSTLMHALIINVALHYSPEEVEFYLIDFKKGVEFKPYATHRLPHARVIAIESEREFGMSVLERLDEELRRRGDLYRSVGVQDLKGFRDAHPDQPMPRVLLIIDEFQELFVKDDKIASEAALLLDRLVRQGRAFGMHVLLGSQTLAGGYSLPRSTIGQMAVRIALQCSESDAHLILSEDNTAARLLTRPGEAIYNNANGRFEGNNPFQVVFLSDSERVDQLERIAQLAESKGNSMPAPVIFEGNIPADPLRTPELMSHLQSPSELPAPRAWLGSAVAIKPPTYTDFPRQSGANLLVVGPQEEMALGVLANCGLSLAVATGADAGSPSIHLIDGTRPESPLVGAWNRVAEACPHLQVHPLKKAPEILTELANELTQREGAQDETAAPRFLILHNLARFRDLRRDEDEFSFSFGGGGGGGDDGDENATEKPDKLLQRLLRDGPPWGIHVLIWADSLNTASRWFDRATIKDFEQRILFQMTASDSANLMDSPAASQLGMHRAILYAEEHGRQEKFRPFAAPSSDWLRWVSQAGKSQMEPT